MSLLITNPINVHYLTGFKSSNAFVLVHNNKKHLFTDSRYIEAAKKIPQIVPHLINETFAKTFNIFLVQNKISQLSVETQHLTVDQFNKFKKICKPIVLTPISQEEKIENQRQIKSKNEIKAIKKAQAITKKVITLAYNAITVGCTEAEIAWKIEMLIREHGGDGNSFDPIVAFGKNSAMPHHHPGKTRYKKNDIILIDAGAKYNDYCGDMTRTFLPKNAPTEMRAAYEILAKAQKNALKMLKQSPENTPLKTIVEKVRNDLGNYNEHFTHSLGHGVGLEIHEGPWLSKKSSDTLKKGQVFSVEPGIYIPGKFGIRIEDLYYVV